MPATEDIENAKKAYDHAWAEATKYANEALEALKMHEQLSARDTGDLYIEKAKRALTAYDNWTRSAELARKVLDEHYGAIRDSM